MANQTFEAKARAFITDAVNVWLKQGGTYKSIADEAGVSTSTIKKLAEGDTTYPRFHTIEAVLNAFGRQIEMMQTNTYRIPVRSRNKKRHAGSSSRI